MTSFDQNLKRLRLQRGMKQEDLADRMNVTRQTVSGWETGRRQPDLDTLRKLAEVLDADIQELIYGNKPEEYPKFQKKYLIWSYVCGGIVTAVVIFRLLIWPHFKGICASLHWGSAFFACVYLLPLIGSLSFGFLIPALIRLFIPVFMKRSQTVCCLISGIIAALPIILFWLNVSPFSKWMNYQVGYAFLSYILPVFSSLCISFVLSRFSEGK